MAELEELRRENGGVLQSQTVLERARSPNSSLHSAFEWNDGEAAERWRLHQASQCIRCVVTFMPRPDGALVPVRLYASDPRQKGYRATAEILSVEEDATQLLAEMRRDVLRTVSRYRRFASLAPRIDAALGLLAPDVDLPGGEPAE
jgi:hypothetical protein